MVQIQVCFCIHTGHYKSNLIKGLNQLQIANVIFTLAVFFELSLVTPDFYYKIHFQLLKILT